MKPDGAVLLALARSAVACQLEGRAAPIPDLPFLHQLAATFVTITHKGTRPNTSPGQLHGCIGSISPERPLGQDVVYHAQAAAFRDPRSRELRPEELEHVRFEVSLLSAPVALPVRGEAEACQRLRPGIDGVTLSYEGRRSVFLPQVWEKLPTPSEFLERLKRKAELPPDFWHPDLLLERFTVDKWIETPKGPG